MSQDPCNMLTLTRGGEHSHASQALLNVDQVLVFDQALCWYFDSSRQTLTTSLRYLVSKLFRTANCNSPEFNPSQRVLEHRFETNSQICVVEGSGQSKIVREQAYARHAAKIPETSKVTSSISCSRDCLNLPE